MTTPRYVVAFTTGREGEGWHAQDVLTGRIVGDLWDDRSIAVQAVAVLNAQADPAGQLAAIARGIGSSPSPDQLTRLHEAAARVLEGR